jgi:hypothetical protein
MEVQPLPIDTCPFSDLNACKFSSFAGQFDLLTQLLQDYTQIKVIWDFMTCSCCLQLR